MHVNAAHGPGARAKGTTRADVPLVHCRRLQSRPLWRAACACIPLSVGAAAQTTRPRRRATQDSMAQRARRARVSPGACRVSAQRCKQWRATRAWRRRNCGFSDAMSISTRHIFDRRPPLYIHAGPPRPFPVTRGRFMPMRCAHTRHVLWRAQLSGQLFLSGPHRRSAAKGPFFTGPDARRQRRPDGAFRQRWRCLGKPYSETGPKRVKKNNNACTGS